MVRKKKTHVPKAEQLDRVKDKKGIIKSKSTGRKTRRKENIYHSKENKINENINTHKEINKNMNESVLKLDNILGIGEINEFHKTLRDLINSNHDILIDASDTQSVDTAALQLLTTFCLKLNKNGHEIKWKNPTQTFIDRCCLLNLEELLKLN